MREIMFTTFADGRVPSDWLVETPHHAFERGGLRTGRVTRALVPLPGNGWRKLRVEIDVEPVGGAAVECGDGLLNMALIVKAPYPPRHRALKYMQTFAESVCPVADKPGVRHVEFELNGQCLRGLVDGVEYLSANDPFPREMVGTLTLTFWEDCLVHQVRVLGDEQLPEPLFGPPRPQRDDFFLEVNVDFFDDLIHAPFTKSMFDDLFAEFENWGVRRVHWIYYGGRKNGWWQYGPLGAGENARATFENVEEIFDAAVEAAHRRGIEVVGLIKPFDMGFYASHGEGTPDAQERSKVHRLGGAYGWISDFAAQHPELMIARRPGACGDAENEVFTRIDLVKEDTDPAAFSVEEVELYVSDDNVTYERYDGSITRCEVVEDYPVYEHTASGPRPTAQTRASRVMRLGGLQIRSKFAAIAVAQQSLSFSNTLMNLLHVFGEKGEEWFLTYGSKARWGASESEGDFRETGVEFDSAPGTPTAVFQGYDAIREGFTLDGRTGFLAFARGKERTPLAFLSPAFDESRAHWLSWVRDVLEAGADGVELRVRAHHSLFAWGEYGFEQPVRDAFLERCGVDLWETDDFDRAALRRLRGESYTEFYRQAKAIAKSYGKPLGLHVSTTMDMEPEEGAAMDIHWDWRRWLDEGLADSITFKEVRPQTRFARAILDRIRDRDVKAVSCPYANTLWKAPGCERIVEDWIRTAREAGFDGYQYYECASVVRGTPDGKIMMMQPGLRDLLHREFG